MKEIRAETKDFIYFKDKKETPTIGHYWPLTRQINSDGKVVYYKVVEMDFSGDGNKDVLIFENGYIVFHAISNKRNEYLCETYKKLIYRKPIKLKSFLRYLINAFIRREVGLVD